MHPSSPLTSVLPPQSQHSGSYDIATSSCWSSGTTYSSLLTSAPKDDVKDVDMKPLDLSIRAPQQDTWSGRTTTSYYKSYTASRPSNCSSTNSRSQRLSPYPVFTPSIGSSSRHLGSPSLAPSRSPLSRSISPYYIYHRQTPSPYYNYLSGSCTPPENCSSLQVLSSTNRLLNGMSSTPTTHFRSFEDASSQDNVIGCESRLKDGVSNIRDQQREVEVEVDEPTYIDMDSATTVKSVSSRHHKDDFGTSSSLYTTSHASVIPHAMPRSFHQNDAGAGDYHIQMGSLKQQVSHEAASSSFSSSSSSFPTSSLSSLTSKASLSSSSSSSSASTTTSSPPQSIHSESNPSIHPCDSSHTPSGSIRENVATFYNSDTTNVLGVGQQMKQQQVSTTTSGINPVDGSDDQHPHHHHHHHHRHHQHQQQQYIPKSNEEELQSHQQNPDSSSSPAGLEPSSPSSTSWRASTISFSSPSSSSNSTSTTSRQPNPQLSPDSNVSRSSTGSPSNKENIRSSGTGVVSSVGTGSRVSEVPTARRSFFQIDKSFVKENGGSSLFSGQPENEDSGRCSILDFWISKILMEETPRRRCSADIRQTDDGNRRIRLRLVDLIELQVEQSLKA